MRYARLRWLLSLFAKRKGAVVPILLAAAAVVGLARSRTPETFVSSFEVRFTRTPEGLRDLVQRLGLPAGMNAETQAQLVASPSVVRRVVEKVSFIPQPITDEERDRLVRGIASGVRARPAPDSKGLIVEVRWGQPEECREIATTLLSEYGRQEGVARDERTQRERDEIAAYRADVEESLAAAQGLEVASARLEAQRKQAADLDARRIAAEQELSKSIDALRQKRAELTRTFAPESPAVREIDRRIDAFERIAKAATQGALDEASRVGPGSALAGVPAQELATFVGKKKAHLVAASEAASLDQQRRAAEADLAAKLGPDRGLKDVTREMQQAKAHLDEVQAMLAEIDRQIEQTSAPFEVLRPPHLPTGPETLSLLALSAIGLAAAALVSLAAVLVLEGLDPIVRTVHDVLRDSPADLLAVVPRILPAAAGPCPVLFGEEGSHPAAGAFRTLAAGVLAMLGQAQPGKAIVMVTSPDGGEGKSTVALNLACAFAEKGSKTLLVDASLRRATLSTAFGVAPSPGLVEVVTGKTPWSEATAQATLPRLHAIPAGETGADSYLLLGTPEASELLSKVSEAHDVVVVDAASVLPVSDALLLAPRVDGVVLVSALGATAKGTTMRSMELVSRAGGRVLGVVANSPIVRP